MTTPGFYDPKGLVLDQSRGSIPFIDAYDGNERIVEFTTAAQARQIATSLKQQVQFGYACLEGELEQLKGSLSITDAVAGEGLMEIEGRRGPVPVKLGFEIDPEALPKHSMVIALGVHMDGAYVLSKIAMKPLTPSADMRPNPPGYH